jgi:indolepyruvate ferredoxin oxidoreductase beta subunit
VRPGLPLGGRLGGWLSLIGEHNILVSSVGGQGGVTLTRVLSTAAFSQGLNVIVGETLGMAQRGGSVMSHVRVGPGVHGPMIPRGGCDVLLSLEPAEALRVVDYLRRRTRVVLNTAPSPSPLALLGEVRYPEIEEILGVLDRIAGVVYPVDATRLASEAGSQRSMNMVILGAYAALGEPVPSRGSIEDAMASSLPQRFLEQNKRAFNLGLEAMRELIPGG